MRHSRVKPHCQRPADEWPKGAPTRWRDRGPRLQGGLTLLLTLLGMGIFLISEPAPGAPISETQLKAAWILNFAKLTEWPRGTFSDDREPIVIGVLDDESMAEQVARTLTAKLAQGRPLTVRRITDKVDVSGCHVLVLGAVNPARGDEALRIAKGEAVLTIDDSEDPDRSGCMLKFLRLENKVRFDVDLNAANEARLKIYPELLGVAHSVKGKLKERTEVSP